MTDAWDAANVAAPTVAPVPLAPPVEHHTTALPLPKVNNSSGDWARGSYYNSQTGTAENVTFLAYNAWTDK